MLENVNLLLHRNDLRLHDNRALTVSGEDTTPLFIFDPSWLEKDLLNDARIEFVIQGVEALRESYSEKGGRLIVRHGDTTEIITSMENRFNMIFFNMDSNHFRRGLETMLRENYEGVKGSAVQYGPDSRERWAENTQDWFDGRRNRSPDKVNSDDLDRGPDLSEIREIYNVSPEKERFGRGGEKFARRRLQKFLDRIDDYQGCISFPSKAEANTSHLSPYIRYGMISPREVYQKAEKKLEKSENPSSVKMFMDRIFWQQHFNQKLEDNDELHKKAINPVYRDLHREERDKDLIETWKSGKTGYPLVDASMRALNETGWLNFRMRAMCASFFSYILKQWWKEGADYFYKQLIDADVAINYYQWQMQSGLVGVHANRIYDPTKQIEDNDPKGQFIRKYVPELRRVPSEKIREPWKMSKQDQEKYGVRIGEDYPQPIVDYKREARRARNFFKSKAPEAYNAFKDDEVWRRASLSDRHSRDEIIEKTGKPQSSIEDFK